MKMWSQLVVVLLASLTVHEVVCIPSEVVARANARADAILKELQETLSNIRNNPLELQNSRIDVAKGKYLGRLDLTGCQLANLPGVKRFGNVKVVELLDTYQNTTIGTIIENAKVTCNFQTSIVPLKPKKGSLVITSQLKGVIKIDYDLVGHTTHFMSFDLDNGSPPVIALPFISEDYLQNYLEDGITQKFNTDILSYTRNFLETKIKDILHGDPGKI